MTIPQARCGYVPQYQWDQSTLWMDLSERLYDTPKEADDWARTCIRFQHKRHRDGQTEMKIGATRIVWRQIQDVVVHYDPDAEACDQKGPCE